MPKYYLFNLKLWLNFILNYQINVYFLSILITQILIDLKPRSLNGPYVEIPVYTGNRWGLRRSLFRDWIPISKNKIGNVFEIDWSQNKLNRLIKDEQDLMNIRATIKEYYYDIVYIYRKYAI